MKLFFNSSVIFILLNVVLDITSGQSNPCAGLPLCKLKKDVAEKLNVPTATFSTTTRRAPAFRARATSPPESVFGKDDKKTAVRLPFRRPPLSSSADSVADTQSKLVSALEKRKNSACAGLILCRLKGKTSSGSVVPRSSLTTTTLPPIPTADPFTETLMSAVLNGHIDTAKQLIKDGSDVNAEDVHGNSVLHIAAQNGRTDIIDDLLLEGAEVNKGNNHRNTALHLAAQNGWTEIAQKLLRHRKIDIDFADLHGNTALHLAAQNGQIGVAQKLIDAGAEINKPNAHKHIPLHLAAQNGHFDLSQLLVLSGADLNYPDNIGNTPLHTAYHTTHLKIAQMLRNSGANAKKRNLSGLKPSQLG